MHRFGITQILHLVNCLPRTQRDSGKLGQTCPFRGLEHGWEAGRSACSPNLTISSTIHGAISVCVLHRMASAVTVTVKPLVLTRLRRRSGGWLDPWIGRCEKLTSVWMLAYYPLEHAVWANSIAPKLFALNADVFSRISCVFW